MTVESGKSRRKKADDIDTITTAQANQYTIVLTVVPAVIIFGFGIFVMVRRKYA